MGDDLYRQIHEAMVEQYLERHPETPWDVAYDRTALAAHQDYVELITAKMDARRKYER